MLIILLEKKYSFLIGWEQCSSSVTLLQKVHQCKLYIVILDYDWLKDNRKFRLSQCRSLANDVMLNILRCVGFFILFVKPIRSLYWSNLYQQDHRSGCLLKRFTKILYGNFEKSFFFQCHWKWLQEKSSGTSSTCTFLWVFQNTEIALAEAAQCNFSFLKNSPCKFISNWTAEKPYDTSYIVVEGFLIRLDIKTH